MIPLQDLVVFPGTIAPLFIGREYSLAALEAAAGKHEKQVFLVAQKPNVRILDTPKAKDIYKVGVVANILQVLKLQDGTLKVMLEGKQRAKISSYNNDYGFLSVTLKPVPDGMGNRDEEEYIALRRSVIEKFEDYGSLNGRVTADMIQHASHIGDLGDLTNHIATNLFLDITQMQELLEIDDVPSRLEYILKVLEMEIEVLKTEEKIHRRVKKQVDKQQRDYYLNEQLKAIQQELGEKDLYEEVRILEGKIKASKIPKHAKEKAREELKKLKGMSMISSEASVIRNYLDWIMVLPWNKMATICEDISRSEDVLNEEHYGLQEVKERVLEHIAVHIKNIENKTTMGTILCFVGPPGVGKTSLVKSIATATGRPFVKISLGGVLDESEIRGHRRTYVGSMPGRIIQSMKKAKVSNPVILLDEIDKMSSDYRGDPASAMLEVLDPQQNAEFNDHYLELDYDISHAMFIATSNGYDGIPYPLLDRMETVDLSGYTVEEKLEIAKKHLIPKQLRVNGVGEKDKITFSEKAILSIINFYTREAGVRSLEREIARIIRKIVKNNLTTGKTSDKEATDKADKADKTDKKGKKGKNEKKSSKPISVKVDEKFIVKCLGVRRYDKDDIEKEHLVGLTNGLAYSQVGGSVLHIEGVLIPGSGEEKITGKLGDVMKESVQAAFSYAISQAKELGIDCKKLEKHRMHIHVPEGATPKDGPSAGIAICTSIVSSLTDIPVRRDVAMTGEITLRGRVLPIGGLKEKLLAAVRAGIKTVIISKRNSKDLEKIEDLIKDKLKIIHVDTVNEVLKHALIKQPHKLRQ